MGMISYWMADGARGIEQSAEHAKPLQIEEALTLSGLAIVEATERWVLSLKGFPREWYLTQHEAEEAALRWASMEPTVTEAVGSTWIVYGGDQYMFTASSRPEAEAFVFGTLVGQDFERGNELERRRKASRDS